MTDSHVQVLPDSTGKLIDTTQLVTADGNTVQRQRVVLGDNGAAESFAAVLPGNALAVDAAGSILIDLLTALLGEVRVTNALLAQLGRPRTDDPDAIRNDTLMVM